MKLVLLGTGGYFPTRERQTACLMLPEIGVVFDAGTGMYRVGKHLSTDRLDIFITHAHLDHVAGLTYLLNILPSDVLSRTTVHGEASKLAAVRDHLFAESIFPIPPPFKFEPLDGAWSVPAGGELTHFALQHPGGSIGYRLECRGRSMAYVTDTTATPRASYLDQIRGVDLLVHEAYFETDAAGLPQQTGHSSLMAVVAVAAEAKVGRLVLVHISPQLDAANPFDLAPARLVFPKTEIATDGMQLDV
jgi:ribonuclease Z